MDFSYLKDDLYCEAVADVIDELYKEKSGSVANLDEKVYNLFEIDEELDSILNVIEMKFMDKFDEMLDNAVKEISEYMYSVAKKELKQCLG